MPRSLSPDEADRLVALLNGVGNPQDVRQTHVSSVVLTPDFAYKRLKPVRFDFLDFSTREGRYVHLANEARLNRRLAGNVYRGLLPLWQSDGRWTLAGSGPPDDWLLAMERLPDAATLENAVRSGTLDGGDIERIAATLAAFFVTAERSDEITVNGDPAILRRNCVENFAVFDEAVSHGVLNGSRIALLRFRQLQTIIQLDEELRTRQRDGWIRNGHGDLRAEHVYLTDRLQILDCIAFNHRLRWIDTADDIGFLAADLIRLGAASEASHLIDSYRKAMNDPISDRLLALYRSYRFAVRAKVAVLRSREQSGAAHAASQEEAGRAIAWAIESLAGTPPWFVVVCGLSGTGKTTIAAALAERIGAVHLSSDRIRKELHGLEPTDRGSSETLYSIAATEQTYRELRARAAKRLDAGIGVVLDATFLKRSERDAVETLAAAYGVPPLFVECRCSDAEIERRLAARAAQGRDASDATFDVWQGQCRISDGYAGLTPAAHRVVDSTRETAAIVDEIVLWRKDR